MGRVLGDAGPVGVLREWLGVGELVGGRGEKMEGWRPLEKGGLEVVVTGGSVKGFLKVGLKVGRGVYGRARGKGREWLRVGYVGGLQVVFETAVV